MKQKNPTIDRLISSDRLHLRQSKRFLILGLLFLCALLLPPAIVAVTITPSGAQTVVSSASLEQQARQLYETGQFNEAVDRWQHLVKSFEATGDRSGQAMALSNLSLTYQQMGEFAAANQAIATSLNLLQDCTSGDCKTSPDNASLLAQTLDVQGRLQFAQGQAETALTTWQRAAKIYAEIPDQTRLTRNQINQAQALQAAGLYRQAQSMLQNATQRLQKEPDSLLKATGLRSLGQVLRVVGDLDAAQQILAQSLTVAERLENSQAIADSLLSLGNLAHARQDTRAAIQFYRQAASLPSSPTTRIQAQINQFRVLVETQKVREAGALLPELQHQLGQLPMGRSGIHARINFAQSWMKLGDRKNLREVAQLLSDAIRQAQILGDSGAESYAIGRLGALYELSQQWTEAETLTRQALVIAQGINAPEILYRWQWQLGRVLRQQGKIEAAIAAYETAVRTLQSLRYDLVAVNPEVQFSFREEVEPVYRELVALLLPFPDALPLADLPLPEADLARAREVVEWLQIAEINNFLREACLYPRREIDRVVDQNQTAAAIYPIILPDRLEVILKLPQQSLQRHTIAIARADLEKVLDQLGQDLDKPHTTRRIQALSKQLYDWMIRPIAAELEKNQIKTLVFVLDGNLRNIPMAVLYDGSQYLIERYSIALTPGLQLLDPKPLEQVELQVLAAGVSEPRPPLAGLPNVPIELKQIQTEITTTQVLLNQQFTSQSLQNQVSSQPFPVIHLATHGQFSSNPDNTFIYAWDRPIKVNELNTFLRNREDLREEAIELLVLSACKTAVGDKQASLGIAGVAVRAGARSTLASLWNVNDASTALFMGQFYQAIADQRITKAEALRQAQLALLNHQRYNRPTFWAPYVLVGNWL